jgi:ABC-type sugar transport system ATPase subunit
VSFLSLERVEKTYPDGTRAVKGVDLAIERGEFIVLLGPSGCGKTTTLRMIAGLELCTGGTIRLAGREVTLLPPSQRDVGMVFQFYALYPHLKVRQNIAFPLECAGVAPSEIARRVSAVAEEMNLVPLLGRYPTELSGGDQQKVSLARAIVRQPAAYLMDEPLGTLDADQRIQLREFIRARQLELKVTTVYVTHDQEEAMSLADRIVVMEGGLIKQVGTPAEVYDRPSDRFVATFVGSPGMNFLAGEAKSLGETSFFRAGDVLIELGPRQLSGAITLGVRAEHVRVAAEGPIAGRIAMDEYVGSHRNVHVDCELGRIVMRSEPRARHTRGESIRLDLDPAHVVVFDERGEARA